MARITPSKVTSQYKWSIDHARAFAADMLEDVNDHALALAIWSVMAGDSQLACDFIQHGRRIEEARGLTPELSKEDRILLERFAALGFKGPAL